MSGSGRRLSVDSSQLIAHSSQLSAQDPERTTQNARLPRSVLIIGSGPIVIGQAAEFDYSGTQACLACRAAGVRTILVNSNPATIQTDPHIADTVYIEPLTVPSLRGIIARERPDGIIATVGGQTALNLSVALAEAGILDEFGVEILGTGFDAIQRGEDRDLFARTLRAIGEPILPSEAISSVEDALAVADRIGYPVMCRSAFALGGAGSGIAHTSEELRAQVEVGLRASGSGQVLIERSVYGWTEVEYEVIRDGDGNAIVVCNMENIDPMGVHTGDSIVIAPSQTLSDVEYHMLRAAAIHVVAALDVRGACNVQFALDRHTGHYHVIEVNPRLSRSSALASKATGYPIAKVATQIALGRSLPEIRNEITGTTAFFEPALDYVVAKIPRWPFDKLPAAPQISTRMRSTGEVMAIGRTVEEALDKAIRSLGGMDLPPGRHDIATPHAYRLPAILQALREGADPGEIAAASAIHPWFIDRLQAITHSREPVSSPPAFKLVDTCAAEFEARTPYFYRTTAPGARNEAASLPGPKAIILGSGPIRIGQGIEFDYATVHACHALSAAGVASIIINNNPETVSTDYSTSDRLYFEPLDAEAVLAIIENEREGLIGVIPQFGGQTAINLVSALQKAGIPILGTPPEWIDAAENRRRTSAILTTERIPAPIWRSVDRWEDLPGAVAEVGFPALLRPSYVLSGDGMIIVHSPADVSRYLAEHGHKPLERPLLIDQFLEDAIELNVDAVSDGREVVAVVMEQLDECGIHSGDSMEVYPVQSIGPELLARVEDTTRALARAFHVVGLMNIQFAVHRGALYVLEVNPRASRSVPFASKASGIPLADLGIRAILGERLRDLTVPAPRQDRICIKNVVFPFRVFPDLDPILGPQMQSTGESMGIGETFPQAYWKSWLGAGMRALPFGRAVLLDGLPQPERGILAAQFSATDSDVVDEIVPDLGLAVVLGRDAQHRKILRHCAATGIPAITTRRGVRALLRAMGAEMIAGVRSDDALLPV
ncbi:MAG TPA: carbamoyl-phosphate synthase large subunit [Chloroflexota bacterium]|nr:carbamoyl-phosphate synthase large subunit [Chloroflexota bacterium]